MAERDPAAMLRAYTELPEAAQGRYISADLMKETFPDYRGSKETRGRYNSLVHNSAAVLASAQFREAVRDRSDPTRTEALFVTGSPGSGKTTAVLWNGIPDNARVVYEGQLTDQSSQDKIATALEAGLTVKITAVLPNIETALENTKRRFDTVGRGATMSVMARIQDETPKGLAAIQARFGERVAIEIIDARDYSKASSLNLSNGAREWQKEIDRGPSIDRLHAHLAVMRKQGRSSPNFERQAKGQAIVLGREPGSRDAQVVDRSSRTGQDREARLLDPFPIKSAQTDRIRKGLTLADDHSYPDQLKSPKSPLGDSSWSGNGLSGTPPSERLIPKADLHREIDVVAPLARTQAAREEVEQRNKSPSPEHDRAKAITAWIEAKGAPAQLQRHLGRLNAHSVAVRETPGASPVTRLAAIAEAIQRQQDRERGPEDRGRSPQPSRDDDRER